MSGIAPIDQAAMRTIFHQCRQCGTCCKSYRRILLQTDEVAFIKKMGGHVGINVSLTQLRDASMEELMQKAVAAGKVYMIHPDDKGCVFLQRRNDQYFCRIYHHRPRTCQGFRCTMADSSFLDLFAADAIHLLGQNTFGLPLDRSGQTTAAPPRTMDENNNRAKRHDE